MARSTKSKSRSSRRSPRAMATEGATVRSHPGGKLGLMVERLSAKTSATSEELVAITGWQKPSVLGALSRLRSRGFAVQRDVQSHRKAYRLAKAKG